MPLMVYLNPVYANNSSGILGTYLFYSYRDEDKALLSQLCISGLVYISIVAMVSSAARNVCGETFI